MNRSLAFVLLFTLVACAGCETRSSGRRRLEALQQKKKSEENNFDSAFNFLTQMHQFDPDKAATQASYHLNKWLMQQEDTEWKPDPMLQKLPSDLRSLATEQEIGRKSFSIDDMYYVESANLMNAVASWAADTPDARLEAWFQENAAELSSDERDQLDVAQRLFDWVVRNIQLDETPPPPKQQAVLPGEADTAPKRPSEQFAAGPGYTYLPRQTLLYGHGDKWNRSRVFIRLVQQRGIEAVVLAADPLQGQIRPWLVGVRIGKQLYLFDMELGLPIPSVNGRGIATLSEARKDPKVLENLKAGQDKYSFAGPDLERVIALIDACPESVSKRMHQLERSLSGERRLVLTVKPSEVAKKVRQCAGIAGVALWVVPMDAVLFQAELQKRLDEGDPAAAPYARERFHLVGLNPIVRGRRLHLRGVFEVDDNDTDFSAKNSYMGFRMDEQTLAKLAYDERTQRKHGLIRSLQETDAAWTNRVLSAEFQLRMGKQNASYWIGLVHYESGDLQASADWLKHRTIEAKVRQGAQNTWVDGANYNLARVYEREDDIDAARRILLLDESPQALGNRIRARLLREWKESLQTPSNSESAESNPPKIEGDSATEGNSATEGDPATEGNPAKEGARRP